MQYVIEILLCFLLFTLVALRDLNERLPHLHLSLLPQRELSVRGGQQLIEMAR